jgi:hypothetical protein
MDATWFGVRVRGTVTGVRDRVRVRVRECHLRVRVRVRVRVRECHLRVRVRVWVRECQPNILALRERRPTHLQQHAAHPRVCRCAGFAGNHHECGCGCSGAGSSSSSGGG